MDAGAFERAFGLDGGERGRPGLVDAVEAAMPGLTVEDCAFWFQRGIVIADAEGRVCLWGLDEEIHWLQEMLLFRGGPVLVSPVLGKAPLYFRIHRKECVQQTGSPAMRALYKRAERDFG